MKVNILPFVADQEKKVVRQALLNTKGDHIILSDRDVEVALFLAKEEATRWHKSNVAANQRRELSNAILAAAKDPEKKAELRKMGFNL